MIDHAAPVRTIARESIPASPERVWHTLTDFERWPNWNTAFRRVSTDGPLADGTALICTNAHGLMLRARIARLEHYTSIGWIAQAGAVQAGYLLTLVPHGGMTLATVEASVASGLARLMPGFTERALNAGLRRGLAALHCETVRPAR
ncbi:SRPBCC family protein [Rhodovulum steppense]|uniref:SRPBCC family protein n=1 Tax=Rhodovulum steppense TaxID=540251 RepID=UPI0014055B53|nr:SRPBCC family protein [Rhodovulum steppense]